MKHEIFAVSYFVMMAAVIIAADVMFLRDYFWARLGTNIAIVAVFALVYLLFFRNTFK